VGSILKVKIQLAMLRLKSIVLLSLLFVIFSWRAFSQCPEKVVIENRATATSDDLRLTFLTTVQVLI
jgi:hypothetical protein